MQSTATTVEAYLDASPTGRQEVMRQLRQVILDNLPEGFEEQMSYGMIGYVVPHRLYPNGYHVDPKLPLPFVNIASQKNFIGLYHMGIYGSPELLAWWTEEFAERSKYKLDMGKSCVRFKKPEAIPFELVGELMQKISVEDWIAVYESNLKDARKRK